MRRQDRVAFAAGLLAVLSSAVTPAAATAADGSLTRLAGAAGCLSAPGERGQDGCTRVRGLSEPRGVVVSPDGRNVYVTSERSGSIAVFRRSSRTGALRQLDGRAGCLRAGGGRVCGRARGLQGARDIEVSPDGRNVYVEGSGAVTVFSRDPRNGGLHQLGGRAGCVRDRPGAGCAGGRALAIPAGLALSPSGRFLYVISGWDQETPSLQGGIAVFRRGPRSGRLVQLSGAAGCVSAQALEGCARAHSLPAIGGNALAIDGAGDHLYAGGGRIVVFDRVRGGRLRELGGPAGCVSHLGEGGCTAARALEGGPAGLAFSASGVGTLYATAVFSEPVVNGFHGTVVNLLRDPATGALSQPSGPAGCISLGGARDCASTHSQFRWPAGIEVSRDGRNAYAALVPEAGGDGLVVFSRSRATGELAQLPGAAGCIALDRATGVCTDSGGLGATAIALSPDGRHAYVSSGGAAPGGDGAPVRLPDAVAVYRRAR